MYFFAPPGASEWKETCDVLLIYSASEGINFSHCFRTRGWNGRVASLSVSPGRGNGKILACCPALVLQHHPIIPFFIILVFFHWRQVDCCSSVDTNLEIINACCFPRFCLFCDIVPRIHMVWGSISYSGCMVCNFETVRVVRSSKHEWLILFLFACLVTTCKPAQVTSNCAEPSGMNQGQTLI